MPFTLITGPCVIESELHALRAAERLAQLLAKYPSIHWVYKSSYDKANRTSLRSFRGPGLQEGLSILAKVRSSFGVPVFTDVHTAEEALAAGEVCDFIQIPAFLCRQTDLLVAAGKTSATVNIKKGQFMAPWDMGPVCEKVASHGKKNITLTERGVSFGYNNLVSDFRSIPILQRLHYPVFFDATHSVQLPGGEGHCSGGEREFISPLSRAAIAAGCDGIYAETHPTPQEAPCDAQCMLSFQELENLLPIWLTLYETVRPCLSGL